MYMYCYSNEDAIYAKGLYVQQECFWREMIELFQLLAYVWLALGLI